MPGGMHTAVQLTLSFEIASLQLTPSFKMGALKGMKVVIGLVPFFILAAFIEGIITRYAFMHWSLKTLIIGLSAVLMIYYFVVYPYRLRHGKL